MTALTIRPAFPDDDAALQRLAQLDSSTVPAGPLLVASVDGILLAALRLEDDVAIADPFHPTAELVVLLAQRARQLRGAGTRRRGTFGWGWARRSASAGSTR